MDAFQSARVECDVDAVIGVASRRSRAKTVSLPSGSGGVACQKTAPPTSPVCGRRRSQPVRVKMRIARGGHVGRTL